MVVYLFPLVVFVVESKGRLAAPNAQWSFDISDVVKYCVHWSGLVPSPTNLHILPTGMNVSITT
jgi:hypothetical protein